jgi:hypothetical protein
LRQELLDEGPVLGLHIAVEPNVMFLEMFLISVLAS